jgi:hypothetical protein
VVRLRGRWKRLCARVARPALLCGPSTSPLDASVNVLLRITRVPSTADATRKRLPFAMTQGTDIVLKSQLGPEASLNDHLVWLWGMLNNERRFLKFLISQGAELTVTASGSGGPFVVRPNGAELLHLLGVTLVIDAHGV